MTIEMTRDALGCCAIINLGLLLVRFLAFTLAHDGMYRPHGRWFRLSVAHYDTISYTSMAAYKIRILLLNLVPYLALRVVG